MSYADDKELSEETRVFANNMKQTYYLLCGYYDRRSANEMTKIFFDLLKDSTPHYLADMLQHLKSQLEEVFRSGGHPAAGLKNQIQQWMLQKYQQDLLKGHAPYVPKLMQQVIEIEIRARDAETVRVEAETERKVKTEAERAVAVAHAEAETKRRIEVEAQLAVLEAQLHALGIALEGTTPFCASTAKETKDTIPAAGAGGST